MLMLYWVYEELEYSPERNVEIFNGLAKTEDDAKIFCERKNSILSSITEKKVDVYKYREVDDSYAERFKFIDKNILDCDFFNASVAFPQNGLPHVSVWDDGNKEDTTYTFNSANNTTTVIGSYPLGISKAKIIKQAVEFLHDVVIVY